jgi:hypothetical protein
MSRYAHPLQKTCATTYRGPPGVHRRAKRARGSAPRHPAGAGSRGNTRCTRTQRLWTRSLTARPTCARLRASVSTPAPERPFPFSLPFLFCCILAARANKPADCLDKSRNPGRPIGRGECRQIPEMPTPIHIRPSPARPHLPFFLAQFGAPRTGSRQQPGWGL